MMSWFSVMVNLSDDRADEAGMLYPEPRLTERKQLSHIRVEL